MAKFLGRLIPGELQDKAAAQKQILSWSPGFEYLVCFDVDGHLLDNMTAKQVIVFQPHFMDIFGLRSLESYYRLHAEHHNLWSKDRGCDRHEAQSLTMDSLLSDPDLKTRISPEEGEKLRKIKASIDGYIEHIRQTGGAYGYDSLFAYQQRHPEDTNLTLLVVWSRAVDLTFSFVTIPMAPFPGVRETLEYVSPKADILIVSKTPYEDICNWLERHNLIELVTAVSGREQGGKDEHICLAKGGVYDAKTKNVVKQGGRYKTQNVIMGGDGEGDLKAVKKNKGFFFPTPPAGEEEAWVKATEEVFGPFFRGEYERLEEKKIEEFQKAMLLKGPWEVPGYEHAKEYGKLREKRAQLYQMLKPGGKLKAVC